MHETRRLHYLYSLNSGNTSPVVLPVSFHHQERRVSKQFELGLLLVFKRSKREID